MTLPSAYKNKIASIFWWPPTLCVLFLLFSFSMFWFCAVYLWMLPVVVISKLEFEENF